ncbi:MAG: glycoside hydrolase family 127 protein [Prolixibacteraceae bacterium]|jgi:DUF1680 family protein|nr:glycoside hydrolase family 127 protein [Prolixibacteraceae bacterium]
MQKSKFKIQLIAIIILQLVLNINTQAQDKLYSNEFPLRDVILEESPFKHAMEINVDVLLEYDTDRLLEPFLTEAGLTPKGSRYLNWDGLAGHIGGHYLTALAMNYSATGNAECESRMDYMLSELKKCQDANGNGYVGGIPNGQHVWNELKKGNFEPYNQAWVPWYNIHKTYAGLRDAWLYGNRPVAKEMFLKLCDWGIDIISPLSDVQTERMLEKEFGGMNEVYADAYKMTGDEKYLVAAKKFTHKMLFDSMKNGIDNLDNLHANTQIPKAVGFARIATLDSSAHDYAKAAEYFWDRVVNYRSLALGGNSRSEHFPTAGGCKEYVTHREGPESCNTYNMLKLSEDLFQIDQQAKYIDFYERALYNHILSTQHPEHGGYVYFTPARPRHYRVYSSPNQAMWCCVGSGMENHGKYGQMIYTHKNNDEVYVNLFIPSVLNWETKNVEIEQSTNFPDSENSTITIKKANSINFKLKVRFPSWAKKGEYSILVNNENIEVTSEPGSYVSIDRTWNKGDKIEINFPMHLTFEEMPNVPDYIAFLYGPILLGSKTGKEGLTGLVADDGRWSHIANGDLEPLNVAPIIQGSTDSILNKFAKIGGEKIAFTAPGLFPDQPQYQELVFEPFARIHDSRYMMYWLNLSDDEYETVMNELAEQDKETIDLDQRTVDQIATGEQQPDTDHKVKGEETYTGVHNNEFYRDARNGGYFSYELATNGESQLELLVRYWGNEWGQRTFDIIIDNEVIATENITGKWQKDEFINIVYHIPDVQVINKKYITVKFKAKANNTAGGVFFIRLLTPSEKETSIINRKKKVKD